MQNIAIIFPKPGRIVIEKCSVQRPGRNQVLIKTRCTLISIGTELTVLSGKFPRGSTWDRCFKFPFGPGYNNIGEIVEVGMDVDRDMIGKRVATYNPHEKYTVADVESCRPVPDGLTDEQAVFFTIAEIVMNGIRRGAVTWGESVAIYGLGLLGQLAIRISHLAGARPIIGLDIAQSRLKYLPDLPGVIGVNCADSRWFDRLKDLTKGRLVDVVFEVTGKADVIPKELRILRKEGRFVILSSVSGKTSFDFHDLCNRPSYEIIGAHNASHPSIATTQNPWTQERHAELFFDLLKEGSVNVDMLISHKRSYQEAPELYGMLLENRTQAMGVVLEW